MRCATLLQCPLTILVAAAHNLDDTVQQSVIAAKVADIYSKEVT